MLSSIKLTISDIAAIGAAAVSLVSIFISSATQTDVEKLRQSFEFCEKKIEKIDATRSTLMADFVTVIQNLSAINYQETYKGPRTNLNSTEKAQLFQNVQRLELLVNQSYETLLPYMKEANAAELKVNFEKKQDAFKSIAGFIGDPVETERRTQKYMNALESLYQSLTNTTKNEIAQTLTKCTEG